MHSVYLTFDGNGKKTIESFRKTYDSLHEVIEAHITVIFPNFDLAVNEIITAIRDCQFFNERMIVLSRDITYDGNIGYLTVVKGDKYINDLHSYFCDYFSIASPEKYVPHVTIVRDSMLKPNSIDIDSCTFNISAIEVEEIAGDGKGKIIYQQKM